MARTAAPLLPLAAMVAAMASFQIGAAIAKGLFPEIGLLGTAALRFGLSALMLLAILRPWRVRAGRGPVAAVIALGCSMAMAVICFYSAIQRLPLAIAIALQFLGPLAVAIGASRRPSDLLWAMLAGLGVWMLTAAGGAASGLDLVGVLFALAAAVGWAAYIILGRVAGAGLGSAAAALAVSTGAVITLPIGLLQAGGALFAPEHLPRALTVAVLSSALPFTLELYAMARLPSRTFAVFTCLEPAFAVLVGLIVLHERLALTQLAGVAIVIAGAAGAAWSAGRASPTEAPIS